MSPEQVRGEKLDARTDLFSFGLVLYEMATGQRAFSGDTEPALHTATLQHTPTPVRSLNREIPISLEQIINKALQKDRALRYQSAAEMGTKLLCLAAVAVPRSRQTTTGKLIAAVGALAVRGRSSIRTLQREQH